MLIDLIMLFIAGFLGGILNSIAGGGSFITFPALLLAGVPPISANATNTFASCSGYISGTWAFRKELSEIKSELPRYIIVSLAGGICGAWLLLQTSESSFETAVPWLLLFATLLFIFGGQLNQSLRQLNTKHRHASSAGAGLLSLLLLGVCLYGGFFNAGLGIVSLSYLALAGYNDINRMNGLKLLISTFVSLIAIAMFIYNDVIAWYEGSIVLTGTVVGGYLAAHLSRKLPQPLVRNFVIVASISITLYFFYDLYLFTPPLKS